MPREYQIAQQLYQAFLKDAQAELDLPTSNATYTSVQAVLTVFRRRLTLKQGIAFASTLPAILRAIFVQDWDVDAPIEPFRSMDEMNAEARAFRKAHNFTPEAAIEKVATALRRHVDEKEFVACLRSISPEAIAFWGIALAKPG